MKEWQTGLPTEPGLYLVDAGRWRPLLLNWSDESGDWREGAVRVNGVRRWYGPIPPPPRPARPELHPARKRTT
jgi:hypothetical protein